MILSSFHFFLLNIKKVQNILPQVNHFFKYIPKEKIIIILAVIGLLSIYGIYLSSRAIIDSDVVHQYLPIAREIVLKNGFTYTNGYDYNILLKPIGVSVLYALTYKVGGSIFSEIFRLLPLIPVLLLTLLVYSIASFVTKSKKLGIISTLIFIFLPLHDRLLFFNAFYPDIFYYPLIFATIYFLLKYSRSKNSNLLLLTGITLGTASLFKAQAIYFLIAFILLFIILELRSFKKLSFTFIFLTPFYILIPNILATTIQRDNFQLPILHFNWNQLLLFLFLSCFSGISYLLMIKQDDSRDQKIIFSFLRFIKKISFLVVPIVMLSSLWYLNNLIRFGTLIWTSSINLPNFNWAINVLSPFTTPQTTVHIWNYVSHFFFMLIDPSVMGYILLISLMHGVIFTLKNKLKDFGILILFNIISSSIILSTLIISLPAMYAYNPRDILPIASLLTTVTAVSIIHTISSENRNDLKTTLQSFVLVTYFGFFNYIHSVLVWFSSSLEVSPIISTLMSNIAKIVGLNLTQTSFQLIAVDRITFFSNNVLRIFALSLITWIPLFALKVCVRYNLFKRFFKMDVKMNKFNRFFHNFKKINIIRICTVILILSIIIIPRMEILNTLGDLQGIKENQLKSEYRPLYDLIIYPSEFEGEILTFKAPSGLPYYLHGTKIIDLIYPANLAQLKEVFESNTSYDAHIKLKQNNINYILINTRTFEELDSVLNFTLSKIIHNSDLAILQRNYGEWKLYTLTIIP
jgi:hypothetical protein